jgi:exopolysaccharide biosynthesis polyprenyl glycosylphosphotransferase
MNPSWAAAAALNKLPAKAGAVLVKRGARQASPDQVHAGRSRVFMSQASFTRMLSLERKRAERSKRQFLLMLLHAEELLAGSSKEELSAKMTGSLLSATRETDVSGWYDDQAVAGAILTEIDSSDLSKTVTAVHSKISSALLATLGLSNLNRIHISFHLFPQGLDPATPQTSSADLALYPDLSLEHESKRVSRFLKRTLDVGGSLLALVVLSPVMAVIAAAIKLTSEGPVLFSQERVGQYGVRFSFLKFRSMHVDSDPTVHQEYVKRFISGRTEASVGAGNPPNVYKLTKDDRITAIGRFLRKTSLDELPQFFNVLSGSMSLVGPRPPIAYECADYRPWHWRRLLEVKPGLTGLWQVSGRSQLTFDDMVRLDLRYAREWSLGLDLKILLQTPRAVFSAEGAY